MSLPGTKSDIMSLDENDRISELREKLSLQARERWRRNLGILRHGNFYFHCFTKNDSFYSTCLFISTLNVLVRAVKLLKNQLFRSHNALGVGEILEL